MIGYLVHAMQRIQEFQRAQDNDRGATAVEYGLMVALIAAVIVIAVSALGDGVSAMFDGVLADLEGEGGGA